MSEKSVTAILVAYNSAGVIAEALRALVNDSAIATIMVVDNCSTDDTCELVREKFPSVKLIENPKNEGFGRANNVALKKVETPYALLVNPDAVMGEGAVATLLSAAACYSDAGIIAPALYDEKGNLHRSHKRNVFAREHSRDQYVAPEGECCAEFLSGAVWLLNMSIIRRVGLFDPNLFLYYEDDDLCLRMRQMKYGLVLVPEAKAVHLMGASSGAPKPEDEFFKQQQMAWSRLYIEDKHHGRGVAQKLAFKLQVAYGFKAAWYCLTMNKSRVNRYRGRLAGVAEFIEKARPLRTT